MTRAEEGTTSNLLRNEKQNTALAKKLSCADLAPCSKPTPGDETLQALAAPKSNGGLQTYFIKAPLRASHAEQLFLTTYIQNNTNETTQHKNTQVTLLESSME